MATRKNTVLASKKWTPAKAYSWAEKQAQKAPAHVGYYAPLPEERKTTCDAGNIRSPRRKERKPFVRIAVISHGRHGLSSVFTPNENSGKLSRKEFFAKLAAFGC